jgi:hypothetical protein
MTMSRKTGTAALGLFRQASTSIPCRAPRHPASERKTSTARSKPESARRWQPFQQAHIAICQEDTMIPRRSSSAAASICTILPVILRITFNLVLWTLGAAMDLSAAETEEHRVVHSFAVERTKMEDLQRWVNAGHDAWCRDPEEVAARAMECVLPEGSDVELASLPLGRDHAKKTAALYTFHSLDGATAYRITLRRYRWLLAVAGSIHRMIWVPERVEVTTRPAATSLGSHSAHS